MSFTPWYCHDHVASAPFQKDLQFIGFLVKRRARNINQEITEPPATGNEAINVFLRGRARIKEKTLSRPELRLIMQMKNVLLKYIQHGVNACWAFQDELSWLKLASRERGFIAGGSRLEEADSQIAFLCFIYLQWQHLRSISRGERGLWTIIENPEWGEILLHFIGLMPLFLISSVWWCIAVFLRFVCGTPHEGTRRPTYCCS